MGLDLISLYSVARVGFGKLFLNFGLFFYSQNFYLLFSQNHPIVLKYSQQDSQETVHES